MSGVTSSSHFETVPIVCPSITPLIVDVTRIRFGGVFMSTLNRLRWNMYSPESTNRDIVRGETNAVPSPVSLSSVIPTTGVVCAPLVVRASTYRKPCPLVEKKSARTTRTVGAGGRSSASAAATLRGSHAPLELLPGLQDLRAQRDQLQLLLLRHVRLGLDAARHALHAVVEIDPRVLRLGEHRRPGQLDLDLADRIRLLRPRGGRYDEAGRHRGKHQQARSRHCIPLGLYPPTEKVKVPLMREGPGRSTRDRSGYDDEAVAHGVLRHRAGLDELQQVVRAAGLRAGAGQAPAAERLAADHRAGDLAVDVQVADRGAVGHVLDRAR